MAKGKLSDLTALMDVQTRASQTKLRKIKAREAQLLQLLADLSDTRNGLAAGGAEEGRTARDFQNDLQHLRWFDQRRAMINIELAQVRALLDMARKDLKHHFARQQALDRVLDSTAAQDRLIKLRRATYGS